MATTPHLGLTLVEQAQAQKEVTVNRAFKDMDAVLNTGILDYTLTTPPGSPSAGDVYIVASSATGDWSGQDGNIAYFDDIWRFIAPNEGMSLWVNSADTAIIYDGSGWVLHTNMSRSYSKQQVIDLGTLTDGATIAWDASTHQVAQVTLAGNRTLSNPNNAIAGGTYLVIVRQDATGGRTLTFGTNYRFAGGTAPTLSSGSNAVDVLSFVYDGTYMLGVAQLDFS
ncbi:MAG: DUF2793 domain-containing protein [Rickettsiales bacterium]|nr:DUF2793 domain-containing protein [Rickettsiales bacterium]